MGHVGEIGRGARSGGGEATRIGPAPTAEGPREGRGRTGERPALGSQLETPSQTRLPATFADALTPGTGGQNGTAVMATLVMPQVEVPEAPGGQEPPAPESPRQGRGRTGERPALGGRGEKTQTQVRLPATFADALTQEPGKGTGTRGRAVMATLIMPQLPPEGPPARKGRDVLPSGSPQQAPQGPPVSPMDTPIGRGGGTRIVRMPEAPGGKERPTGPSKGGDTQPGGRTPTRDGFGATPTTGNRPALGQGEARGRVLPVRDLLPGGLEKLLSQEGVAKRFASDLALLHQQLRPSEMPSSERALRAWAFFTAYAEAAAGHESTPEGRETFDKALKDQGFSELRDAHTGDDGLAAAQWVLEASNPEEARSRAEQVKPEPPPEVKLSESAQPAETPRKAQAQAKDEPPQAPSQEHRDNTFSQGPERPALERIPGQAEFVRVSPQLTQMPPQVMVPVRADAERLGGDEAPLDRWKGRAKRLGRNMLWNVLHRFRAGPEDSAIENEKWDQIAFGAVLAIVGMMVLIILLVAL
jgi:hypothetical protein